MKKHIVSAATILLSIFGFCPPQMKGQAYNESPLYSFCSSGSCNSGSGVTTNLIQASDGDFYGLTEGGPTDKEYGTIFRLTPTGEFIVLHTFCALGAAGCTDAEGPGGLIEGGDGNLYGFAAYGGAKSQGGIFKLTQGGYYSVIYSFCSLANCADGAIPFSLVQGADGNLYGTTISTIFRMTTSGRLVALASGMNEDVRSLVQDTDGNFYGTTSFGGASNVCSDGCGTIFRMNSTGVVTLLYSFCSKDGCSDGFYPNGPMIEGNDGNLYGTTFYGGEYGEGTAFMVTPAGALTTLYQFCSQSQCIDGEWPNEGMALGSDGYFYGTTELGGDAYENEQGQIAGAGTLFRLVANGTNPADLTTLFNFCNNNDCSGGDEPMAGLVQGSDGNFYGTTGLGGTEGDGVIYKLAITPALPPPVQVSLSASQVMPGRPVTASLKVLNAFSLTMQQCYAFQNGTPLGKVPGTYNSQTKLYTFSDQLHSHQRRNL